MALSLKRFDLFPKLNAESQRTTEEGGLITLIGMIIACILMLNETIRSFSPFTLEKLELFQETQANLSVYLDVTFFHLTCEQLIFDVSSAASNDIEKQSSGWDVRLLQKLPILDNEDGCQVRAVVDIAGYQSGEMHVALSPHVMGDGQLGFTFEEYFQYNASHEITSIAVAETSRYIDDFPRLSFQRKTVPAGGTGRFVYDFQVVPQTIRKGDTQDLQFLMQCREQDVITHDGNEAMFALQKLGLPGVFMTMQMSTLMVLKVETKISWGEYLISLLGIVAGTSAIVAFVDSFLHETFWKAKLD
jgi:hypothetical protein